MNSSDNNDLKNCFKTYTWEEFIELLADSEPKDGIFAAGGSTVKSTYREEVLKTWSGISGERALLNCALGLTGEAGEVADLIKKHAFHGHPLDREKLIKEIGDVFYYAEVLMYELGVTREEVEKVNTEKLAKRYSNGFSTDASMNRKE